MKNVLENQYDLNFKRNSVCLKLFTIQMYLFDVEIISDNQCYKPNSQLYALIVTFLLTTFKDALLRPVRIIYICKKNNNPQICFKS